MGQLGGGVESRSLPQWTLSARLDGGLLEFTLGDGRRLSWRARRPAELLASVVRPSTAAELLGDELVARLAGSAPRALSILYDSTGPFDSVDWEHLGLGARRLCEHFDLGRQFLSDTELAVPQVAALVDTLAVCTVHQGMPAPGLVGPSFAIDDIDQLGARAALSAAQVLVADGLALAPLLQRTGWHAQPGLLVVTGLVTAPQLAGVLDAGAAVLCLAQPVEPSGEPLLSLLHQLGTGLSLGEALGALHRRAAPQRLFARLYGDPAMRFVRQKSPTSRRQVTSLSFDIVGSTAMMAVMGDEAYAERLAEVHARCTDIVRRRGGQPNDPQGNDGVMCYFGHPAAVEDAAVHAVEAGLQILRTVAEVGMPVRVGIATGQVAVNAGHPFGLWVHLAARLQQTARPGTVQTSESTRRLVAHAFELKLLEEPLQLKGFDGPEPAYLVLGPRSDARDHPQGRLPAAAPLVGRQAELERLHECWRSVGANTGRLAVVSAEAGMGKSRLVREFRHQLVQAGVKVLECRCRADASASPFLTLAEALRRWLDIGPDDGESLALQKLAAAVPAHAREGEALALLAALLGLAPQPVLAGTGSPRQRLLGLLVDWFQARALDQPGCLIVEDWHWVDPSMREFVEQLVQRPDGPGLLVVITVRSGAAPLPFTHLVREHIALAGLAPTAARELVERVCAGAPLSPRLIDLLAARGDGVPLFLEEAARMAVEIVGESADAERQALGAVPASLQDLLMARLDGLGAARSVAQVAAVLGRQFTRPLLAALLDASDQSLHGTALDERLQVLVASGLVRSEGEGRYAFRHALIRDAAYASLWTRDRRALHAQVVKLLQQRWPEVTQQQPELLALHQTEAGLHAQALAQWELAARHAAARSAELEAISHLRQALSALVHTEAGIERDRTALRLQLLLAARLLATEGYGADAVLKAYLEAQRLCDCIGDDTARFKVEMGLEAYRFMRADFAPALEHGRQAAAIAAHSGNIKQRLHAHWGLACTLFHQGRLRATMAEMDTVLSLYTPVLHAQFGIQDPGVMCMAYSSWGLWELGRPDAALLRIQQAVKMADEFQHRFSQAVALAYAVSIELLRGDTDAALARAEVCLRVCEDSGFPVWLAITRCMRGYLLCERGDFDTGLREMSAGYAQWLGTGALVSQPLYLALQVQGLMLAGQLDAAAARVDEGLAITARYGECQLEAELMRLRGEIALQRGQAAEGEAWLRRAYGLALRQHRLGFALRSATALARHWAAGGGRERALRLLVPLAARWDEGRGTRDLRVASALIESLS